MNKYLIILLCLPSFMCDGADLPTVTIEHLYYLHSRAERVRRLRADEMIDYCIAQKIGGRAFEDLYSQLFTMRIELTKLLRVEEVPPTDPRVLTLNKTHEEYLKLLREEAQRVQNGLVREGQAASDTLEAIARAQSSR